MCVTLSMHSSPTRSCSHFTLCTEWHCSMGTLHDSHLVVHHGRMQCDIGDMFVGPL